MAESIELVLFDLDGTLIEFHHDYLLEEAERIIPLLDHPSVAHEDLESYFEEFNFFGFVHPKERDAFVDKFWDLFNWDGFPKAKPLEKTMSVLDSFRDSGIKMGIVTSRLISREGLIKDLEHTDIVDYMSFVKTRTCDNIHWSDKRDSLKYVLNESGVDPKRVAMIGDIPPDVESAIEVGIGLSVAVLTGGIKQEVLARAKPDHIISSIGELPNIVLS